MKLKFLANVIIYGCNQILQNILIIKSIKKINLLKNLITHIQIYSFSRRRHLSSVYSLRAHKIDIFSINNADDDSDTVMTIG